MSNPLVRQQSLRKQTRSALERIEVLEQMHERLVVGIDGILNQLNTRLSAIEETLEAVSGIIGPEQIANLIVENRKRRSEDAAAAAKAALDDAIAKGIMAPAEVIGENTLVVGRETDKDGNQVGASRIQLAFMGIKPQFRDQLLGKGVGTKLTTENEGTFEVIELYNPVEKSPEQAQEDAAQEEIELTDKLLADLEQAVGPSEEQ
jgi:hypothetical protein